MSHLQDHRYDSCWLCLLKLREPYKQDWPRMSLSGLPLKVSFNMRHSSLNMSVQKSSKSSILCVYLMRQ